jgi:hypothetical protein
VRWLLKNTLEGIGKTYLVGRGMLCSKWSLSLSLRGSVAGAR